MTELDLALKIAFAQWGKPYIWGGDNPQEGFDCSGFVIEILKSVGMLPEDGDWTAHQLMGMFRHADPIRPGCLYFWDWNGDDRADHVEMVYCMTEFARYTIGASGGGSRTQGVEDAIRDDAYIKIRPARANAMAVKDPFVGVR